MSETFIRTSEHGGFLINEYKGNYSLNSAWEADDGTVRQNWALRQKGKDKYADKATPIKIELGDKEHAEAGLLLALKEITGKSFVLASMEDVPF
jgi:hypothetical protein